MVDLWTAQLVPKSTFFENSAKIQLRNILIKLNYWHFTGGKEPSPHNVSLRKGCDTFKTKCSKIIIEVWSLVTWFNGFYIRKFLLPFYLTFRQQKIKSRRIKMNDIQTFSWDNSSLWCYNHILVKFIWCFEFIFCSHIIKLIF